MLEHLHIENFVLTESLDLSFGPGLSVITGETGAGKSVLIGAIGLLLGQRADLKTIKEGASRCLLEARFTHIEELQAFFEENDLVFVSDECLLRRELYANGKSRAFINDSPVSLGQLKELGGRLLDLHSQHQNLLLGKDHFQLSLVDSMAGTRDALTAYREAYEAWREALRRQNELEDAVRRAAEEQDYLSFQYRQLDEAGLKEGELAELEAEQEALSHAEDIKSALAFISESLGEEGQGVCPRLQQARHRAGQVEAMYARVAQAAERIESCLLDLKDLQRDLDRWNNDLEADPRRLEEVEDRLNLLFTLVKKHRVDSVEELIALRNRYKESLDAIEQSDERLETARQAVREAEAKALSLAKALSQQRRRIGPALEQAVEKEIHQLGMPHGRFLIQTDTKEMDHSGIDKVSFLFSANKNIAPHSIQDTASGGEISRLMLSLKALTADRNDCSTLIFDEIDTGVSGEIAHKMGLIMQKTAQDRQVICISHLPQIAAKAEAHYKVYKTEDGQAAVSHARLLDAQEHLEEIARMLSGASLTEAALENARQLING